MVFLTFERISGKDTLTVWYQESDSDAVLIDFSRVDNPLEMHEIRVHPVPNPDRDSLIREIHWVARADSSRNYPIYFRETLYFNDGS